MTLERPDWKVPSPRAAMTPTRVWRLRLSDLEGEPLRRLRPLTVSSEQKRARQFRFDSDQHRHLAGRGLIRVLLAHEYGCPPQAPSIVEDDRGKPHVEEGIDDAPSPEINISHTAELVVGVWSREHPVGIDAEPLDRVEEPDELAWRVLTETERQRLLARPPSERGHFFIHLWTCKEAFLKAIGTGLRRSPDTIKCLFEDDTVTALDDTDGYHPPSPEASASQWSLHPFLVSEDVAGAVVRHRTLPSPLSFADAHRLVNDVSSP